MNSRHIVDRFHAGRERREAMVLVTVYETLGSTYSKAGSRMLIAAGGDSQGLVSGGCLEGDLAERARTVLATNLPATLTYDLRDEAEELFGLGIGCNGLISVLLQPLGPDNGYEPMATIAEVLLGNQVGGLATVLESRVTAVSAGAAVVRIGGTTRGFGLPDHVIPALAAGCLAAIEQRQASLVADPAGFSVLYAPLIPVPRVLVLGAGLDAVPLVNVLAELGWRVTLADHRPAYLARQGFSRADAKHEVRPEMLASELELADFDAIVVMSHHLATDRKYLQQLAQTEIAYIGLLGPPARKQRLLNELAADGARLAARLRGPVGIDISADTAESIAVSIAAEIQSVLATAGGSGFRRKA
jgi:xanthine/CO dehydrogenase XdhC/CoxF family maturation factor